MTRINLVPVTVLHDKHLIAEYHELPRAITLAHRSWEKGLPLNVPRTYRMGTGHVKFFYNKMPFLLGRMEFLRRELKSRGVNLTENKWYETVANLLPLEYHTIWLPNNIDIEISVNRLLERMPEHYSPIFK